MIHEIGRELEAELKKKGCGFKVLDREATGTASFGRERIVLERAGSDSFARPPGTRTNPSHRFTRSIGCKITIYAKSPKDGAQEFEHERRAEHVLDLVLACLDIVAYARKNAWRQTGGTFIVPADMAETEKRNGAVYELTFTFDRAVTDRDWEGEAQPEITLDGTVDGLSFDNTTEVSLHGAPAPANETACGG